MWFTCTVISFSGGKNILHFAVVKDDNYECAEYIIENYSHLIHTTDLNGNTPLHEAAKHGSVRCLTALLDAGSDFTQVNMSNQTPLDIAKNNNHEACAQELEKRTSLGRKYNNKRLCENFQYVLMSVMIYCFQTCANHVYFLCFQT